MSVLSEQLRERIRQEFPKYPNKRAVVLPALHMVHDAMRAVSTGAIEEIAELLELHPSEVHDTMSFYNFFKDEHHPLGKHRVWFEAVKKFWRKSATSSTFIRGRHLPMAR